MRTEIEKMTLGISQICEILGIQDRKKVSRFFESGLLRGIDVGGGSRRCYRCSEAALAEFIATRSAKKR